MIAGDQPTCFPPELLVCVSSKSDGTVLDRTVGVHNPAIVTNRTAFCEHIGVSYGDVVYQRIVYDETQTYDKITEVKEQDTCKHIDEIQADALVTDEPGVALMLPIADCVGTVIYDPVQRRLALVHLGRHSTIAQLMTKTIEHFVTSGSNPRDLIIWMAPSIKASHYRMEYFDHAEAPEWRPYVDARDDGFYLNLHGFNRSLAVHAGVLPANIHESPHNTATHDEYFSHSVGDPTGRFAVLAMMR